MPGLIPLTITALALVGGISSLLAAPSAAPGKPTDVFLVAHQDDWQLFMGDVAFKAIRRGNRAVFIYLTAGDDNRGPGYWSTRQRGALQSTRLAANVMADSGAINCAKVSVLAHAIQRCTVANTASYFLRLPDGRRDGAGLEHNALQSLRRLRSKRITAITAVDSSETYKGWEDVAATVEAAIRRELSAERGVTVHTNDPNAAINPRDHSDHRMAGMIGAGLSRNQGWALTYYVGYALVSRPDNRTPTQVQQKTALFLVYEREMLLANREWSTYSERPRFYSMCMLRTYARKVAPR